MQISGISEQSAAMPSQTAANQAADDSFAKKLQQASAAVPSAAQDAKLRTACRDMEAVFLNMMWSQMRATVPKDSLLGDNSEENVMRSLLDTELTKNMAQAGGVGLADMLYRQLAPAPVKNTNQAPR